MKNKIIFGLFLIFAFCVSNNPAQTTFVFRTARVNTFRAEIGNAALDAKPDAIAVITPVTSGGASYPHPLGVWFVAGKWWVYHGDQSNMQANLSFSVSYWSPDANHFHHTTDRSNIINGRSRIDSPALDNHPNARFHVFQAIIKAGETYYPNQVYQKYNETDKKWYIENLDGTPLGAGYGFNIVIESSGMADMTQTASTNLQTKTGLPQNNPPTAVSPNDSAPVTTGVKVYFTNTPTITTVNVNEFTPKLYKLDALSQTIPVEKKSRLIINAGVWANTSCGGCNDPQSKYTATGSIHVNVNDQMQIPSFSYFSIWRSGSESLNINNYVIEVEPGTYKIEFLVGSAGNQVFSVSPLRSSIMVIPIE